MSISDRKQDQNYRHPAWCDPRICAESDSNLHHRSSPMSWDLGCDVVVTVGLSQTDEVGTFEVTGRPHVSLSLLETESVTFADRPVEVDDAWLDSTNARLLAAALSCAADQLDALQVTR